MDKPIFIGNLSVLPIGWKQVLKKTWQEKYCLLYKASNSGIERLEMYDSADQDSVPRIITLENCIKIEPKSATVFSVITKSNIHDFLVTTEESLQEWISKFQQVAFKDFNNGEIVSICEDNDLYCPSEEKNEFNVILHSTEASNRCMLEGKTMHILVFTSNSIQLFKHGTKYDRALLFTWPYCYVRRYGHKDGKFTFEAGRKCESGEGIFLFEYGNQQEIFRCVSSKMKTMKKLLKESVGKNNSCNLVDSPIEPLNCDNQLQAGIMEVGSRYPLLPFPTTLQDIDSMTASLTERDQHTTNTSPERAITKEIPKKPPRKNISNNNVYDKNSHLNYESVGNYDEVEKREDAWKTLGTVDVRHSDHVNDFTSAEESTSKSFSQVEYAHSRIAANIRVKQTMNTVEKASNNSNSKVLYSPEIPTDDNIYNTYDHLSFFGSTSKLCSTPSNGYKQVVPVQSTTSLMSLSSTCNEPRLNVNSNDYDEVGMGTVNIDMNTLGVTVGHRGRAAGGVMSLEGVRMADDSHLGYAIVRKPIPIKDKDNALQHKVYNDNPYAIISKPKHV